MIQQLSTLPTNEGAQEYAHTITSGLDAGSMQCERERGECYEDCTFCG